MIQSRLTDLACEVCPNYPCERVVFLCFAWHREVRRKEQGKTRAGCSVALHECAPVVPGFFYGFW